MTLTTRATGGTACDDYFTGSVMARVLLPVCAACHVAGGAAAGTRLQIVADDPAATRAAVALVIDTAAPASSRLLVKPTGGLGHGGGAPLASGSDELKVLQTWVDLVTQHQCDGSGGTIPQGPGATLYLEKCASCHGTDARGGGTRPAIFCNRDIHAPVRSGRPGPTPETTMPPFPKLTDADIALIQATLDEACPAATASGLDLFVGNCGTCHGVDARGRTGPDVHCGRAIGDAVRNGLGGMPALMRITDSEIHRIGDHLLGLCPVGSTDGATLFASNCASCHGASGAGDGTRPDIRCSVPSRITNAVRKGRGVDFPVMPSFGTAVLTDAELASVMAFVAPFCSGQPADLFASNCATCHGATGTGGRTPTASTGRTSGARAPATSSTPSSTAPAACPRCAT